MKYSRLLLQCLCENSCTRDIRLHIAVTNESKNTQQGKKYLLTYVCGKS